jgi:hypothetical protein
MPSAEDLFSITFGRFLKNWTFIISLRQVANVALPIAEHALADIHTDYIDRIAVDPEYKKLVVRIDGGEADWDEGFKTLMRTGMTTTAMANATSGIDAASLVFAQSILDDCALSYLKVCSLAAPQDWEPFISDKKVDYKDLQGKTTEEVRAVLIQSKLDKLEWESLLLKVDLLFKLCTPEAGYSPINNYTYDRDKLKRIDDDRHGIIHRDCIGKPVANIDDDLDYISKTANYLMALVNHKYGVHLNVLKVMNIPTPSFLQREKPASQ